MRFYIIVNPIGSKFAKNLKRRLSELVLNRVLRSSRPRSRGRWFYVTNNPLNKVEQFKCFRAQGISSPQFATTSDEARNLDCRTLLARTLIKSTNGRGIIEFEKSDGEYPRAPLYTEYIPKKAEYRVHVFNGEVIDVQQKRKRRDFDAESRNTRIKNVHNGYTYCRDGITHDPRFRQLAIDACSALGYFYGAVDIIYNEKQDRYFVIEVNSRPGLMGTTLNNYCEAIINVFNLRRK